MTNTVTHTPGPWETGHDGHGGMCVEAVGPGLQVGFVRGGPQQAANARLIAAAPDLLEALEAIDADWSQFWPGGPEGNDRGPRVAMIADETRVIWRKIRAALEKARG